MKKPRRITKEKATGEEARKPFYTHMKTLKKQLDELKKLKFNSYGKDFLLTWEKPEQELRAVVALAELFSEMHKAGKSFRTFDTGLAISIFRDNSTRTRFSFASAAN